MGETVPLNQSRTGRRWLDITARILVALLIVIAAVGIILNIIGVVGVWIVHGPAINVVTNTSATLTHTLGTVNNGLTRANTQVQDARQTLAQVNAEAANLGNQVQTNNPVVTRLSQLVDNTLGPRIENTRMTASSIHDAVVSFNAGLVTLNRLPGVNVPTLNNVLASVSERTQQAQARVQDLRVTLAEMQAGLVTNAKAAVTQLTSRIDTALGQVQGIVNQYQAKVTNTQARITSTSNTFLLLINALAVSLTILFFMFAAGLVLLIYVCWQYVRKGRFPSLRVVGS